MWQKVPQAFPFQWTAHWPLIGVALAQEQVSEAVEHARALLEPAQMGLPDALAVQLIQAIAARAADDREAARAALDRAEALAQEMGYL
jgi:hypothetical protein